MRKLLALQNLSVTKKLLTGFGLLMLTGLLLSLSGFQGLKNSNQSLKRISRVGAIFDETVAAREANFAYMLERKADYLAAHNSSMEGINQKVASLQQDINAGNWPLDDRQEVVEIIATLNHYQQQYHQVMAGEASQQKLSQLNEQLGVLQEKINGVYLKVENRAGHNLNEAKGWLATITLAAVVIGLTAAVTTSRQIVLPLRQALRVTRQIAEGDLTSQFTSDRRDELGQLICNMARMKESLHETISAIHQGAGRIAASTDEIVTGNTDLSSRTEQQAAAIVETAASMEELTATVKQNAENAHVASQQARDASDRARQGGNIVADVIKTMNDIAGSSNKISEITDVINSISFQTNILALNAAVEAARAGEHGRGFAMVAGEVRSLAQRCAHAAKQIEAQIFESVTLAGEGSGLVTKAGQTMEEIVESVSKVTSIMSEIATASDEQNLGIGQVGRAITEIDSTTQQNAALVQKAAAEAASLDEQAVLLTQAIATFKLA